MLARAGQDLPWLIGVARRAGGPILELACGTGRVTVPLAVHTKLPVVGLDVDASMLRAARARGVRQLVQADMRNFAFAPVFALVAVPYNSLQLLDPAGRGACLRSAAAVLLPEGILAIECTDFQTGVVTATVEDEELASHDGVVLYGSVRHDLEGRRSHYRRRFVVGGSALIDETAIWSLGEDDVVAQLEPAGFLLDSVERDGATARYVATLRP